MKAVTFAEYGGPEVLHVAEVEEPHAGPGQVRIAGGRCEPGRLEGAQRHDARGHAGQLPGDRRARGVGRGRRGRGRRERRGRRRRGLRLRGRSAAAEHAILDVFARKPAALDWPQAAGLPVAAETSVRVFNVLGGLHDGQTLVIDGATGGVGTVAVQLARARGARVIGTAGEGNHAFLRELGAAALGVKVTGGSEGRALEALAEAAALYEAGCLQLPVQPTFTFAQAPDAHRLSQDGHVRGKLVLIPG